MYNRVVIGILLANTGSPEAATPSALRRYLAQFLSDRRVVDLPGWLWKPILYGIVLNIRPARSARLYRRIWTPEGSPLAAISQRIAAGVREALSQKLSSPFEVALGMRYGEPSIASVLRQMRQRGVTRLLVLPLFPQYSLATTASIQDAVLDSARDWLSAVDLRLIKSYHQNPAYLAALQHSIQEDWASRGRPQRLLFSFHGIPASYLHKGDPYPQHCRFTAEQVAHGMGLSPEEWQISYQSRFGPARWLQPYTFETLKAWGEQRLASLGVVCPGFAADCLETLEEIEHAGRRVFQQAGGGEYRYIPALNDRPEHIQALCSVILAELGAWGEPSGGRSTYSTSP